MTAPLLTANDVARLCGVDLKTIHNWANKAKLAHHRTVGRHLRFRRVDVLHFLRQYGYPVPDDLLADKPHVVVVDADANAVALARRALTRRFAVETFADPLLGLLALPTLEADVVVLDDLALSPTVTLDATACIERLRGLDATKHVRAVVFSARADSRDAALRAGACEFVQKGGPEHLRAGEGVRLREAVERATALRTA
jgi:excisionase family DNA binding protein